MSKHAKAGMHQNESVTVREIDNGFVVSSWRSSGKGDSQVEIYTTTIEEAKEMAAELLRPTKQKAGVVAKKLLSHLKSSSRRE